MTKYNRYQAFYTLVRREYVRMLRISTQVFLPPVITTSLYFLIFGTIIGRRIGDINGFDYTTFIAPGLIMMSVITSSYGNVASSFYSVRFQKNVEEMLVSPMSYGILMGGFVIGGVLRGFIVGLLVFVVSCFFISYDLHHWVVAVITLLAVSLMFSLAGFTNAMLARNFDDVMIIPTFVLMPLTYLGGVFFSTTMLSAFWQKVSLFNPILYMVSAFRYGMLGQSSISHITSLAIIFSFILFFWVLNLVMMYKGVGLRE